MKQERKHTIFKSFAFAIEGAKVAFTRGRNFRIQCTLGAAAILTGLTLGLTPPEWVTLILITAMVLILELINTSIEAIVDIVSPEIRPEAKLAKDVAAAAVLVASVAAVFIAIFLFLPKLLS